MEIIFNRIFQKHETGLHPENKMRLDSFTDFPETVIPDGEPLISLVHDADHINRVREACAVSAPLDADTQTSPGSFQTAVAAAAATVLASQRNGFALVRPPGHHAYRSYGSGFCLFNNIAIATEKLLREGKKVAIVDFDGHYGDGTADIFYDTERVLYCSLHQFPAFPGKGSHLETGSGKGKGYTINMPLNPGSGDDIFIKTLNEVFIPAILRFAPDNIGVSAGFDAFHSDPLLQLKVSRQGFYEAGKLLGSEFPKLFAVLEGGYNITALPECIHNFIDGVNGNVCRYPEKLTQSNRVALETFEFLKEFHLGSQV